MLTRLHTTPSLPPTKRLHPHPPSPPLSDTIHDMYGYFLVAACGILSGTVTFGGKVLSDVGVSLFEIAIYRYIIGTLVLLPFVWTQLPLLKRKWKPLFFLGLVGGSLCLSEIGAVVLGAPVALAAFLIYTQPVWTLFLAWFMLGEQPTKRKIVALIIALIGIVILLQPWQSIARSLWRVASFALHHSDTQNTFR